MQKRYQNAIQLASKIIADAFMNDIEGTLELGTRLDKAMQDVVRELGRSALTQVYNAVDAVLIRRYQGPGWKIKAHPTLQFTTILGPVQVRSAYLWHKEAAPGIRPLKALMGIEGNRSSEAVHRAMVDFGSEKSFERATRQFAEHYGWEVGRGTLLNQTEQAAEMAEQYMDARLQQGAAPSAEPVETMVVELDGCEIRTGQMMTAGDAGRSDLPSDQGVRLEAWKEVRTGLVRPLDQDTRQYVCRMAGYPELCQQLFKVAQGAGLTPETLVIAPGDGGPGLKEEMARHFVKFQYILDHRHLETHLYETADALGVETAHQKTWVTAQMDHLWDNNVHGLRSALETVAIPATNDRLRRLINHVERFADAIEYGRFREYGWPIGSGEVESAHRYVPQERLKIAGACWHPDTVNPMLSLRVIRANGWWDDFWTWRHEHEHRQKQEYRPMSKGR